MTAPQRKNAQELFQETNSFMIDRKVGFSEAFPEIKYVIIEVKQTGRGIDSYSRERAFDSRNFEVAEYIASCSNPFCYGGGLQVGPTIRKMVRENVIETEGSSLCRGREASPKGRRTYGPCNNHFSFKITIKYREQDLLKNKNE